MRWDGAPNDTRQATFIRSLWRQRIDRVLARAGFPVLRSPANHYREPHFHYDPAFEALGPTVSLFGYFQSELYFGSIAEQLPRLFEPRDPLGDVASTEAAHIGDSRLPVSLHIRRGDYMQAVTASDAATEYMAARRAAAAVLSP